MGSERTLTTALDEKGNVIHANEVTQVFQETHRGLAERFPLNWTAPRPRRLPNPMGFHLAKEWWAAPLVEGAIKAMTVAFLREIIEEVLGKQRK